MHICTMKLKLKPCEGHTLFIPQAVFILNTYWSHVLVYIETVHATTVPIERNPILMSRATRCHRGDIIRIGHHTST
jgi:hypothetical protein